MDPRDQALLLLAVFFIMIIVCTVGVLFRKDICLWLKSIAYKNVHGTRARMKAATASKAAPNYDGMAAALNFPRRYTPVIRQPAPERHEYGGYDEGKMQEIADDANRVDHIYADAIEWANWMKHGEACTMAPCDILVAADAILSMAANLKQMQSTPGPILQQHYMPVDMLLFCPVCGTQHIDAPDLPVRVILPGDPTPWHNPPHRSHLCGQCGCIWRPADVPTNGVKRIGSAGQKDTVIATTAMLALAYKAKTADKQIEYARKDRATAEERAEKAEAELASANKCIEGFKDHLAQVREDNKSLAFIVHGQLHLNNDVATLRAIHEYAMGQRGGGPLVDAIKRAFQ